MFKEKHARNVLEFKLIGIHIQFVLGHLGCCPYIFHLGFQQIFLKTPPSHLIELGMFDTLAHSAPSGTIASI